MQAPGDLSDKVLKSITKRYGIRLPKSYVHGGVIGVVDMVGCQKRKSRHGIGAVRLAGFWKSLDDYRIAHARGRSVCFRDVAKAALQIEPNAFNAAVLGSP